MHIAQWLGANLTPNIHKKAPHRVTRGLRGLNDVGATSKLRQRRL